MSDTINGKRCRTRRYGAMPETPSNGLARFDELVAEVMAEWRIPGLALAVVRRNEAPLLRCWGVYDIDTGAPVTPDTVFPICSVTKSFTATALALLVDQAGSIGMLRCARYCRNSGCATRSPPSRQACAIC